MTIQEATVQRIKELSWEKEITVYKLAEITGMSPSTIKSILSGKSRNPGIANIWKIVTGLKISIPDFFRSEIFYDLDEWKKRGS